MTTTLEKFKVPVKNEKWRFSGLKEIELVGYTDAQDANSFKATPGTQVISGKQLTKADRDELWAPFMDFGSRELESQTATAQAFGAKVVQPKGQSGEVHIFCATLEEKSFFRGRVLAVAEEKSSLTLVERLSGQKTGNLYGAATRLRAKAGATLNYVLVQDTPLDAKNFNFIEVEAYEGAQVNVTILNLGSAYTRQEVVAILKGREANVQLRSLSLSLENQEIDQRTLQIHEAPNAKSDLLFKNVLNDKARTVFSGMIRVAPGAQKTDAYQKNRNLILSDDAQANTLPGLEIEANDVRCTHGATVGRLSEEEIFYLRARGIPERAAQAMLVSGYCEEILGGLPEDDAQWARERVDARLNV